MTRATTPSSLLRVTFRLALLVMMAGYPSPADSISDPLVFLIDYPVFAENVELMDGSTAPLIETRFENVTKTRERFCRDYNCTEETFCRVSGPHSPPYPTFAGVVCVWSDHESSYAKKETNVPEGLCPANRLFRVMPGEDPYQKAVEHCSDGQCGNNPNHAIFRLINAVYGKGHRNDVQIERVRLALAIRLANEIGLVPFILNEGGDIRAAVQQLCFDYNCPENQTAAIVGRLSAVVRRALEEELPPRIAVLVGTRYREDYPSMKLRLLAVGRNETVSDAVMDFLTYYNLSNNTKMAEELTAWVSERVAEQVGVSPFQSETPILLEPNDPHSQIMAADVGTRWEPFVDNFLVHEVRNIFSRLHLPKFEGVVFRPDPALEGGPYFFTILRDHEGAVRLYYTARERVHAAYKDGNLHVTECRNHVVMSENGTSPFVRPNIGLHERHGSTNNNIVFPGGPLSVTFTPFLDSNPDALSSERYKALAGQDSVNKLEDGVYALASADGITWGLMANAPVLTRADIKTPGFPSTFFDTHNAVFWDHFTGRYKMFTRYNQSGSFRSFQISESRDFLKWSSPRPATIEWLGSSWGEHEQIYTPYTSPAPDAPHLLLGYPMRCWRVNGECDAILTSSRDGGESWNRLGTYHPWIASRDTSIQYFVGNNTELTYDLLPAYGLIQTGKDEHSIFVQENVGSPTTEILRYSFPTGRYGAFCSDSKAGSITTRVIFVGGNSLILNYDTGPCFENDDFCEHLVNGFMRRKDGAVAVELLNSNGAPIPGFSKYDVMPMLHSSLSAEVRWKGNRDLTQHVGKPVRLRFYLKDACIYALRFQ